MNPHQLLKGRLAEGEKEDMGHSAITWTEASRSMGWLHCYLGSSATPRNGNTFPPKYCLIEQLLHKATVGDVLWIRWIKNESLRGM